MAMPPAPTGSSSIDVVADWKLVMPSEKVDEEFLNAAPRCRIVANMAVGYDNFDVAAMTRHGVLGTNTPDVLT